MQNILPCPNIAKYFALHFREFYTRILIKVL